MTEAATPVRFTEDRIPLDGIEASFAELVCSRASSAP
jgi:hypothetical protein